MPRTAGRASPPREEGQISAHNLRHTLASAWNHRQPHQTLSLCSSTASSIPTTTSRLLVNLPFYYGGPSNERRRQRDRVPPRVVMTDCHTLRPSPAHANASPPPEHGCLFPVKYIQHFLIGLLFTHWIADSLTLWKSPETQTDVRLWTAATYYAVLMHGPPQLAYVYGAVALLGAITILWSLRDGRAGNLMFDGGSICEHAARTAAALAVC
ncbi:hypothetical protein NUW54_g14377 [Trametes sanguinea]|uniref:Uncharacterized protein n=1 Tax=Trametes sanguinea TaxID=158606 RepID=A0ACC1MES6_9APHY|nr:hypothetical protein NUW54_g14377 [Trametes sanguinea]